MTSNLLFDMTVGFQPKVSTTGIALKGSILNKSKENLRILRLILANLSREQSEAGSLELIKKEDSQTQNDEMGVNPLDVSTGDDEIEK